MCNLYSITTNQAAIAALFRVMTRPPRWHSRNHLCRFDGPGPNVVSLTGKQEKICRQIELAPRQTAAPRIHHSEMSALI
jgi:hypothetical protein